MEDTFEAREIVVRLVDSTVSDGRSDKSGARQGQRMETIPRLASGPFNCSIVVRAGLEGRGGAGELASE